MIARGIYQPELGDKSDEILVANAAVTVWVNLGLTTVGDFIIIYSSQDGAGTGESKAGFSL
jgi:hypothetical protein